MRTWVIRSATKPQTAAISTSTTRFSRFIQTPPPRVTAQLGASCCWRPASTELRRRRNRLVTGTIIAIIKGMPELGPKARAQLPDSAFAYIDSGGHRRLPINDEAHVRNALARFNQVRFEDEAARDRARTRLLRAAKKYGIVPLGFMTGQLRSQSRQAAAGKAVIELGGLGSPEQLEARLRTVLGDPTLAGFYWSRAPCPHPPPYGQTLLFPGGSPAPPGTPPPRPR